MTTTIRDYKVADAAALAQLYFDSIRHGASSVYTRQQTEAWAPHVPKTEQWADRLNAQVVYVAEDDKGIAGIMTYAATGCVDLAFVRPDRIGSGVGRMLYVDIERSAGNHNITRLYTHASELARPMFERYGWIVITTQEVERHGVKLTNHYMEKFLRRSIDRQ